MRYMVGIIGWLVSCCVIASAAQANEQSFAAWQQAFRAEAQSQGISASLLDKAFAGLTPNDTVIRLDRKQPESTMTLTTYLARVVSKSRIQKGQALAKKHQKLLQQVSQKYGVQPRFILALWGIETSYGKITGGFSIVEALATLAYDGRRSSFFRKELLNALQIVDQGHISLEDFKGSWAGAMGQTQFMPSSFLSYAEDFDGDGRKDIWNSLPDIFASIANYLAKTGWNDDETWGRKVAVPSGFDGALITGKQKKSLPDWSALGVTRLGGAALPQRADLQAALLYPGEPHEGVYLIYENFNRIMRWNRSHYFATAVGTLSDAIAYGK
jgi:membrane-bound lytic murein transglycosylase B